jgi:hypothetical protein
LLNGPPPGAAAAEKIAKVLHIMDLGGTLPTVTA